jgi:hypothetical protein
MKVPIPVAVLALCVGCQFSASCGNKTLNMDKARDFISATLEREVGQKPSETTCPDSVKAVKDATFQCTAKFGPKAIATIEIKQDDAKGNVTIQSVTGVLIASKLEAQIAGSLGTKLNAHLTVSCGDRVRAAVVGDHFTCEAKDAKGATGQVEVIVKDTSGHVEFKLVEPPPPAAPGDDSPGEPPAAGDDAPDETEPPASE